VATDNTPPVVSHTVPARVEATDTITVRALDPSGIAWIGFRVDTVLTAVHRSTGITPARFDSLNVGAGNLTDVTRQVQPRADVARHAGERRGAGLRMRPRHARNCAFSQTSTVITPSAPRALRAPRRQHGVDTVVVVRSHA